MLSLFCHYTGDFIYLIASIAIGLWLDSNPSLAPSHAWDLGLNSILNPNSTDPYFFLSIIIDSQSLQTRRSPTSPWKSYYLDTLSFVWECSQLFRHLGVFILVKFQLYIWHLKWSAWIRQESRKGLCSTEIQYKLGERWIWGREWKEEIKHY